ncbi:MAG: hypothetical protein RIQ93_2857 [Verrucomicrobiota bacterium]|jgi:hypothetical protein
MSITRRHFLVSGASLIGACLLPSSLLKRLERVTANPAAIIDAPSNARETLYATLHDDNRWQLALGRPTTEFPAAPSWREWLADYESVDPDDDRTVAAWFRKWGPDLDRTSPDWIEEEVDAGTWEGYLEGRFLVYDSPEAHALRYLSGLKLAHGPLEAASGEELGRVVYYHGTMPGADSHFVEVEGAAILPALQHRLRELGESTAIEIIT